MTHTEQTELNCIACHFAEEYNFPEANIYNVDETGIIYTFWKRSRILGPEEQEQAGAGISGERVKNVTAVYSRNYNYIPTVLI